MYQWNVKPGQLIEVHWVDPCVASHWEDRVNVTACNRFVSEAVGWVHVVDDFGIVLTASREIEGEKQLLLRQHLPWGCIEEVWVLETKG